LAQNGPNSDINSNNNSSSVVRKYNIPVREQSKRQIRRLIAQGLTTSRICEILDLPERTVKRYISDLYKEDNSLLLRQTAEDAATFDSMLIEQLSELRQQIESEIVRKPDSTAADKIEAFHLMAELSRVVWVVRTDGSIRASRRYISPALKPSSENRLIDKQSSGLTNIVLVKPESEEQAEEPEEEQAETEIS